MFIKNSNGSTKYSVVNGKKKLKKIILKNRLYYSFLHNYIFKNSQNPEQLNGYDIKRINVYPDIEAKSKQWYLDASFFICVQKIN